MGVGAALGALAGLAIAALTNRSWIAIGAGSGAVVLGYCGYRMGDDVHRWMSEHDA